MTEPRTMYHRTQRGSFVLSKDPRAGLHCTIYAGLTCAADSTDGRVGPNLYGDDVRRLQRDTEGGIDLYDLKVAMTRLGVPVEVYAAYGPGREYAGMPSDHPATTLAQLQAFVLAGHPVVVQGDYGDVPDSITCLDSFNDGHAIAIPAFGFRTGAYLWSDPLCASMKWVNEAVVYRYGSALAGAQKLDIAVFPKRVTQRRVVRVLPGPYYRYRRVDGDQWTRSLSTTAGFTRPCSEPVTGYMKGRKLALLQVLEGGNKGIWVNWGDLTVASFMQEVK